MTTNRNRKRLLVAGGVVAVAAIAVIAWYFVPSLHPSTAPRPVAEYYPTSGWRTSTPEEQGFDSAKLNEMLKSLDKGGVPVHSVLIVRNGYVVLDAYFEPYNGSFPHKLQSVTKSVTATLVGIAIDQGKLQLDQTMVSFFPDRTIANLDERKSKITVRDLVSMRNGMFSGCVQKDVETLEAMFATQKWVQDALDRKMMADPDEVWCYDSPGMHILSAILQKATGMTELEYAQQNLFEPLGITDVFWEADPQGYTHGWGDLYLKPPDAAKIGYLWLNQGRWEDKQIVSASWVSEMVKPRSHAGDDEYGYGIWVARSQAPDDSYFAVGRLGQFIRVYPSYNAIIVITAEGLSDYDEVGDRIGAAFLSLDKPLLANPAAVAELNAIVKELAQLPAFAVSAVPETAAAVTGKRIAIEDNPQHVTELRLEFNDPKQATLYITKSAGGDEVWSIGLDGNYRFSTVSGEGVRGYWPDEQTFVIETFEEGPSIYRFEFNGDRVAVDSPEEGLALKGKIEQP